MIIVGLHILGTQVKESRDVATGLEVHANVETHVSFATRGEQVLGSLITVTRTMVIAIKGRKQAKTKARRVIQMTSNAATKL